MVLTVAVLQTAVVPVFGMISDQLHVTPTSVSWVVTANLLSAAAATPLLGRLADRYSKKAVLVAVLAVVLAGSLIAATTTSLALLIAGRTVGFASLAVAHDAKWQVIVAGVRIYISLAYGALPTVVVNEAGPNETGVATGINAIARTIGSSIAALVAATLAASHGRHGLPAEGAFVALFVLGAVTAALAAVLIAVADVRNHAGQAPAGSVDAQALNHEWG